MITVGEAERIILSHRREYGIESVALLAAPGRVLAEDLLADRDFPPYDRVTMDGIAIRFAEYAAGARRFRIGSTLAAGDVPPMALPSGACLEIMTGAALPVGVVDTVVPYENLSIEAGTAHIGEAPVRAGQNVHRRGSDRQAGETVALDGHRITAAHINLAASIGKTSLKVRQLPRVVMLSSGDELVDVADTPLPHQIRRSNLYANAALLKSYGIEAALLHLPDEPEVIRQELWRCQRDFDVIVLSGGVSMGKFDYIPAALEATGVQRLFHKVRQRPGKPFWFGVFGEGGVVFALPGNPVSTFLCLHRYLLPWLDASLDLRPAPPAFARLAQSLQFEPELTYFMQVKLRHDATGQRWADPVQGGGSGDFANLLDVNAFLELPAERTVFEAGEVFRIWPFE